MKAARVFGTLLLAMTLVFGSVLAFIPLGDAAYEKDGTRTTDTYSMFSKYRETTPAGEEADGIGGSEISYSNPTLDGRGGITFLRLMGPILVASMVLVFAGLLLTAIPKTSPSVWGGVVALPGALLILLSVVILVPGAYMHADDQLGNGAQVDWNAIATSVAVLAIATSTIAAGMGLVSTGRADTAAAVGAGWGATGVHGTGWVAGRNLRCPDCSTVVTAGYGVVPICPTCNFGADYDGPAAPPVPVRAISN